MQTRTHAIVSGRRAGKTLQTKLDQVRLLWAAGDKIGALRICAAFFDQSADTQVFKAGWDAHQHRAFYTQLGKDADALISAALAAMAKKFELPQ